MFYLKYVAIKTMRPVTLQALTVQHTLELCENLVRLGYAPTIEKDDAAYSVEEFKLAIANGRFAHA